MENTLGAYNERGQFWNSILTHRYGRVWNYDLASLKDKRCSPIVKSMVSAVHYPQICHLFSRDCFKWKIHSGNQALFWEDVWLLNRSLSNEFPELYRCSLMHHQKVSSVVKLWLQDDFMPSLWLQSPSNNLVDQITYISSLLRSMIFSSKEDVLVWVPANGRFTTKDGYSILVKSDYSGHRFNVWSQIWNIKAPPKILAFLWKLAWGILPTKSFLNKRLTSVTDTCTWCIITEETISHLFWTCELAQWAWNYIGTWWSLQHIQSRHTSFSLYSLLNPDLPKHIKRVWKLVVAATLWTVWLARNEFCFRNSRLKEGTLQKLIFVRISKWGLASRQMTFGDDPLWKANPMGALNIHHHKASASFWKYKFDHYDYTCMVDGARDVNKWGNFCCGMGGCIKDKQGRILYCFSGPVKVQSILEAEISAILHVINYFSAWAPSFGRVVICSDSTGAINSIYQGLHNSFPFLVPDFDLNAILDNIAVIQFVPSSINDSADKLAKDGLNRPRLFSYRASH